MLIYFDASRAAKGALDELLKTGEFQDTSEVVSLALTNYAVIRRAFNSGEAAVLGPQLLAEGDPSMRGAIREVASVAAAQGVPDLFVRKATSLDGLTFPPIPQSSDGGATTLPPHRWPFGQFNKILPVKAACRALLNLQLERPAGIPVNEAASKISHAACSLGDYLLGLDERHDLARENAFRSAFPTSGVSDGGSRLRFATQFVASLRQNQLSGLPAALRLVAVDEAREPRLTLTRAGAEFAALQNPVLDGGADMTLRKFNEAETEFLLAHVAAAVPGEMSAYLAVIHAIQNGANTPEQMDAWLRRSFHIPNESDITKTFLTTQRTGAISRMVDLGLVARQKSGLHVRYCVTPTGQDFANRLSSPQK